MSSEIQYKQYSELKIELGKILAGTDIIEVKRIEKLAKRPFFFKKCMTQRERDYLASKGKNSARSAAGIFAAKEAFGKAVGLGVYPGTLKNIEILHYENGKPYLKLHGDYACFENEYIFALSISHSTNYAVATVVGIENN